MTFEERFNERFAYNQEETGCFERSENSEITFLYLNIQNIFLSAEMLESAV